MSEKPTLATPAQSLPFPATLFSDGNDQKVVGQVTSITGTSPKNELIALDRLDPNPFQPRGFFDDEGLRELADSINEHGLLHPILVGGCGPDDRHLVICGERRVRAVRLLGWTDIPSLNFGPVTQTNLIALALTENLVRVDLSPFELATTFRTYIDQVGTITDLSVACHRNIDTINRYLELLKLPPEVIESASRAGLSFRRWRAVYALPTTAEKLAAIQDFAADGPHKPDRLLEIKTPKATTRTRVLPSDASSSEAPTGFPGRFQKTCIVMNGDKPPHKIKITVEGRRKHIEPGELRQVLVELLTKTYGDSTSPLEAAQRLVAELGTKGNES